MLKWWVCRDYAKSAWQAWKFAEQKILFQNGIESGGKFCSERREMARWLLNSHAKYNYMQINWFSPPASSIQCQNDQRAAIFHLEWGILQLFWKSLFYTAYQYSVWLSNLMRHFRCFHCNQRQICAVSMGLEVFANGGYRIATYYWNNFLLLHHRT